MNNFQKRFLLFFLGCISVRVLIAYYARYIALNNPSFLPYLGLLALIPVIGWFYILFIKPRDTGFEVFGDKIWWNKLRYLHAFNYICFSVLALQKNKKAYLFLVIDVIIGVISFLIHHYKQNNFQKLFSLQ